MNPFRRRPEPTVDLDNITARLADIQTAAETMRAVNRSRTATVGELRNALAYAKDQRGPGIDWVTLELARANLAAAVGKDEKRVDRLMWAAKTRIRELEREAERRDAEHAKVREELARVTAQRDRLAKTSKEQT